MNQQHLTNFDYQGYFNHLGVIEKKNAPEQIYCMGDVSLLTNGVRVSVVGSRKASKEGLKRAEILTKMLVKTGITVVSGLAEGIDTMAHTTAIKERGKTIAVLGTPLDKTFPAKNKELLAEIKEKHLAVSQFPIGYPTGRKSFPMRNRTMALITDATVIVEASDKSGTRHQGWEALRLGRQVFILQNVAEDPSITWTKEMMKYGAQILSRGEHLEDTLYGILPSYAPEMDLF